MIGLFQVNDITIMNGVDGEGSGRVTCRSKCGGESVVDCVCVST